MNRSGLDPVFELIAKLNLQSRKTGRYAIGQLDVAIGKGKVRSFGGFACWGCKARYHFVRIARDRILRFRGWWRTRLSFPRPCQISGFRSRLV
jgi:hypothetical protein